MTAPARSSVSNVILKATGTLDCHGLRIQGKGTVRNQLIINTLN